jgi:DNA-binding LacI/PurR family transcriptional regulator
MRKTDEIPYCAREMIAYIEERLLSSEYSSGTRLPSIRRFAGKFNISYGSAARGIEYLCSRGLLEKKAKSGIFVRQSIEHPVEKGAARIVFFAHTNFKTESNIHSMCYTTLLSIQKRCLELGHALSIIPLPYTDKEETLGIIRKYSADADGIILFHEYDAYLDEYPITKPTVGIMMSNSFSGTISTVNMDPYLSAEQAVEYFKRHGCGKVKVFYFDWPIYRERAMLFQTVARYNGIECRLSQENGRIRFDHSSGYYFTSDQVLDRYSKKFMKAKGKPLAEVYTVLGTDGKCEMDPDFHRFPTIAADWREVGRSAVDECLKRINNPGISPQRIYLPGRLKEY